MVGHAVKLAVEALAVGSAMAVRVTAYLVSREHLKKGDKDIEKERKRERENDRHNDTRGGISMEAVIKQHCLHPQHPLTLVAMSDDATYTCDACKKVGSGSRYHCNVCNFNLHWACAVSDRVFSDREEPDDDNLHTYAHEHPLSFVLGKKRYTCQHCHNESFSFSRYQCRTCEKQFHPICVKNPTRLISFLHPDHELELKTRRYSAECALCHQGGAKNARVYRCKSCEVYVHPQCAQDSIQYYSQGHPLHNLKSHVLILRELPIKKTTVCGACRKTCKYWHCTCSSSSSSSSSSCCDVSFHKECVQSHRTAKEPTYADEIAQTILKGTIKIACKGVAHAVTGDFHLD